MPAGLAGTATGRAYDVVVFGATGFTGQRVRWPPAQSTEGRRPPDAGRRKAQLTPPPPPLPPPPCWAQAAEYLAERARRAQSGAPSGAAPPPLRVALAARSRQRLEALQRRLAREHGLEGEPEGLGFGTLVADTTDPASLRAMAATTRVLLSFVGPYSKFGMPVAEACFAEGAHLCDITGEAKYQKLIIDRFHDELTRKGQCFVTACGYESRTERLRAIDTDKSGLRRYDSVPSDVATFLAVKELERMGEAPRAVVLGVGAAKGGVSGGTIASGIHALSDKEISRFTHPHVLADAGDAAGAPRKEPPKAPVVFFRGGFERWGHRGWLGPSIMESVNSKVVYRSASLPWMRPLYGDLEYREGTLFASRLKAWAAAAALGLAVAVFWAVPHLLLRLGALPRPGEGPSKELRDTGFFNHYLLAESGDEDTYATVHVRGARGDPGYKTTAAMAAECAICLAREKDSLPGAGGGVLTPASCFGAAVVDYLTRAGVTFEVRGAGAAAPTEAAAEVVRA